jgi:hypothetical protein
MEKKGEAMTKESEPKRGLHQRVGPSVDGVEEDRIDELLELTTDVEEALRYQFVVNERGV